MGIHTNNKFPKDMEKRIYNNKINSLDASPFRRFLRRVSFFSHACPCFLDVLPFSDAFSYVSQMLSSFTRCLSFVFRHVSLLWLWGHVCAHYWCLPKWEIPFSLNLRMHPTPRSLNSQTCGIPSIGDTLSSNLCMHPKGASRTNKKLLEK